MRTEPRHIVLILGCFVFGGLSVRSQTDSATTTLKISGYAEAYYCYDLGNPANHTRPDFVYSFNRHNEFNINLGYIHASYERDGVRSNLALMAGTYAQYNLADEHPLFQHVFEANAGFKISRNKNTWIDAGIMPSHIGFESAVGKNCWNLTRSILADNSPYFETGVRLSFTSKNEKLYLSGLLLNGWQRIQRIPGNQSPAFGTQLTYKPETIVTINWSTYIGNEFPDSTKKWRYFNNFYGILQLTQKFGVTAGFDIGLQQMSKHGSSYDVWYSPVLILRFSPTTKVNIAARAEYYSDEKQVIILTGTENGFQTLGYSANLDFNLRKNFVWRIEGRVFNSRDTIFIDNSHPSNTNYFITTSLAVSF